jgi:hypothetical protein
VILRDSAPFDPVPTALTTVPDPFDPVPTGGSRGVESVLPVGVGGVSTSDSEKALGGRREEEEVDSSVSPEVLAI